MIEWLKHNYPLLPGLIVLFLSLRYHKRKVWWWVSLDDEFTVLGSILIIFGFMLFFIGVFIKLTYLN